MLSIHYHTPWCTVKERHEGCIRQGAHGAEEQPCPGLRTNLQYRRNGARNTGSIRFVLLTAWTDRRVDRTVSPSPLYGFVALTVRPWPPTPNVFLVKCIVSPSPRLFTIKTSAINLEAGNFDIHKRTICVKGRPVQCLQVSHQKARSFEFDGYIPWIMRPVPVQAIMGYSSFDKDRPPSSHPYEVVVNWWQVFVFLVGLVTPAWL